MCSPGIVNLGGAGGRGVLPMMIPDQGDDEFNLSRCESEEQLGLSQGISGSQQAAVFALMGAAGARPHHGT